MKTKLTGQDNLAGCLAQDPFVTPEIAMRSFDNKPKEVRDRINASPFKLCPLCVGWDGSNIEAMEDMLRASTPPGF